MRRSARGRLLFAGALAGLLVAAPLGAAAKRPAKGRPTPGKSAPAGAVERAPQRPAGSPASAAGDKSGPAGTESAATFTSRGPTRIDFDDRLIQGQTNKSGAVYLFDRKELAVRSMVQQRTSFRDQIVKDILSE